MDEMVRTIRTIGTLWMRGHYLRNRFFFARSTERKKFGSLGWIARVNLWIPSFEIRPFLASVYTHRSNQSNVAVEPAQVLSQRNAMYSEGSIGPNSCTSRSFLGLSRRARSKVETEGIESDALELDYTAVWETAFPNRDSNFQKQSTEWSLGIDLLFG